MEWGEQFMHFCLSKGAWNGGSDLGASLEDAVQRGAAPVRPLLALVLRPASLPAPRPAHLRVEEVPVGHGEDGRLPALSQAGKHIALHSVAHSPRARQQRVEDYLPGSEPRCGEGRGQTGGGRMLPCLALGGWR